MQKLESRPESLKVQKFLNYERLNLKTNIYNSVLKQEKTFNQLNAPDQPEKPKKEEFNKFGAEPSRRALSLA